VFRQPVDVGDLLRLTSRVIYTSSSFPGTDVFSPPPTVVVEVSCQVVKPERCPICLILFGIFKLIGHFSQSLKRGEQHVSLPVWL
jgi:hypothetical protein